MKKSPMFKKLPAFLYKRVILPKVKKANTRASQAIPKYEISNMHIRNAKLIATREELLRILPQNGTVAELGVDEGDFSNSILSINKPKKLHLVDFWGSKRYNQDKRKKVESRFQKNIEDKTVEINIGLSTTVVDNFKDNYFDWVYIDTSHSYKTTINELELYSKKVKEGGVIAGHDYIIGNWDGLVRYGVIEAVYEFCVKFNWEIIFLTAELNNSPSFAIRHIADNKQA
ncbi:class I SAM-dependent methyltransferase [Ulvibacterium sp.]|uniref:class I SAM-dependent methyltransferase n=1 Tax=Ulvibacterium sp. TaxID=2665914 RepID=UPI003CC63505